MKSPDALALLAGIAAASIWGGMYVISDVVLETVPPFMLLSLRLLLGIASLWAVLKWRRLEVDWSAMRPVLLAGFVGYGVSLGFQFVGTRLSTAANGALITSATPAFVAVFAAWLLREHLTFRTAVSLTVATAGVLLVVDPGSAEFEPATFLGNLALLGAALTWGLYSVLVRRNAARGLDITTMTYVLLFGGLPLSLPLAFYEWQTTGAGTLTPGIVLGILYLGVVSTAGAMFLWNYAFARLRASTAAIAFFAQPVVGAGLSAWLLREELSLMFFAGGALILAGVWMSAPRKKR